MVKEVAAFAGREEVEAVPDGLPEAIAGALASFFEPGLELGEGLFDRVEIGAVGRQIADSDDVARSFRDHVARCSDMMSPACGVLLAVGF